MTIHRSRSAGLKNVTKSQNIDLIRKVLNNPSITSIDILVFSEKQLLQKYKKEFNLLFTEFRENYPEHECRTDVFLLKALRSTIRRDKLLYDHEKEENGGIVVAPTGNKRLDLLIPLFRQFDENGLENEIMKRKSKSNNKMNIENEKTIENGIEESLPSVEKSLSIESVDITQKEAMNIEKESDTVVFNQETSQRNPLSQDDETESDYELENENTSEYELESDNDIESEMMIENENEKVVSERHRILNERGKKKEKEVGNEKELVNEKEKVVHESEKEKENEVLLENETNGMNHQDEIRMNDNERNMVRENERDDIRMNDNERNMTRENDRESIRMNDNTSVYGKDMEMGNSYQPFIDFTSMNRPDNTFTQFLDFLKEDKKRESDSQMQILMNLLKMVSDSRAYDARFSLIENKIESLQQKIDKLMDLLQQQNTNNANN